LEQKYEKPLEFEEIELSHLVTQRVVRITKPVWKLRLCRPVDERNQIDSNAKQLLISAKTPL